MLQLDMQSRQPIYEQLMLKLSELVILGAMKADEQLPSVRSLARDLGVNPNTVQKSYQELERRGIIYSVAGKGSFIASGKNANEMMRSRSTETLRAAIKEGKRAGLTRQDVDVLADHVYEGEDHND